MSTFLFPNNVKTTLASPITSTTATSCTLSSSTNLPSPSAGQIFALTFNDVATGLVYEIVYVTARTGAVCTIVRGQEGTTAQTWLATDLAYCAVTAGILDSFTQDTPGATPLDTSATAQTKVGALTVTGGLTSGDGVAVGGALSDATTGAFSGAVTAHGVSVNGALTTATTGSFSGPVSMDALTATSGGFSSSVSAASLGTSGAIVSGGGVEVTSSAAFGIHMTQAPTNGAVITPLTDSQLGTMVFTNSGDTSTLLEVNQISSSEMQLVIAGVLSASDSTAYSDVSAATGDIVAQRGTSSGAFYAGGVSNAGQVSWNVQTLNQFTLTDNFVGFANFVAGTYTNSSDERLKENIVDLPHGLDELKRLRAIKYNFKSDKDSTHFGFSAQKVQGVLPDLVAEGDHVHVSKTEMLEKPLGIKQPHLLALVAKSVQQLDDKHEALAAKLKAAGVTGF